MMVIIVMRTDKYDLNEIYELSLTCLILVINLEQILVVIIIRENNPIKIGSILTGPSLFTIEPLTRC